VHETSYLDAMTWLGPGFKVVYSLCVLMLIYSSPPRTSGGKCTLKSADTVDVPGHLAWDGNRAEKTGTVTVTRQLRRDVYHLAQRVL
jgi:hypothetical protein